MRMPSARSTSGRNNVSEETPSPEIGKHRARLIAAMTLAILAAFTVSMSVNAFWLHDRVFDTEKFVETLAPLPQNPAVSTAIATRAVEALDGAGAAETKVAQALPEQLAFLAPDFTGLIEQRVFDISQSVVESERFGRIWTEGLYTVHSVIIGILEGDAEQPTTGSVGVELDGAVGAVISALEARGIDLFSDIETSIGGITVVQAEVLAGPRAVVNVFNTSVWLLPVLALLLVGIAVAIDRDRLRPVQVFGFGSAIAILMSLGIVRGVSNLIVLNVEDEVYRDATGAVWDALLSGYALVGMIVGALALAVGLGAWWFRRSAAKATPDAGEASG